MKKRLLKVILVLLLLMQSLTINAFATDSYEPNDSFDAAQPITATYLGTITDSYISTLGDVDYYKFTTSSYANISLISPTGTDYDLYLYDKNLNLLYSSTTSSSDRIICATTSGETCYIKVVSKNGDYSPDATYRLIVAYKVTFYI